jgi:hypothetical protein
MVFVSEILPKSPQLQNAVISTFYNLENSDKSNNALFTVF